MTEEYEPCIYEKKLNKHLVVCQHNHSDAPKNCEYRKYYPSFSICYCKRRASFMEAERICELERKAMLERASRDGEQYHENNKYVNNRRVGRPIDPNLPMGEGV